MEANWHYLINQLLNVTKRNFKKALKISNYHDAALKKALDADPANPDLMMMYNRYHPLHLALVTAYTAWKDSGGQQEGQTLNVDQLLLLLKTKVNKWDNKIQETFETHTPQYKAIFPDSHYPFNSGSKDERINAVNVLSLALEPYPALAAVKTEVDTFYTTLDNARDTQEGVIGGTKLRSKEVNTARIDAMIIQYGNLGFFMNILRDTPLVAGPFFELNEIMNRLQVLFTGTLDANENEPVLVHTFVDDDQMKVKLTGSGTATLYLADTPGGTNSTPVVITGDAAEATITIAQFAPANYGTHRYLTFINNTTNELHYEIELLG